MKVISMNRKIDELGRIVIPMEIRNKLKIREKDNINISVEGSSIVLKKTCSACFFCGSEKNLKSYNNILICDECLHNIADL